MKVFTVFKGLSRILYSYIGKCIVLFLFLLCIVMDAVVEAWNKTFSLCFGILYFGRQETYINKTGSNMFYIPLKILEEQD